MSKTDEALLSEVRAWMQDDPDPATREELQYLIDSGSLSGLRDRFSGLLQFGTAGLRGLIGGGPNRMNRAVVLRATAGFCRHLLATVDNAAERGVVIGYDARRMSTEFADDVASVVAGHGMTARVFTSLAATPLVGFAVLDQKAAGGVVITASHNPPDYNGYKVYWENGAQIIPPHDAAIAAEIARIERVETIPRDDSRHVLGDDVRARYLQGVAKAALHPEGPRDLCIAYTAMHGVGGPFVRDVMSAAGFSNFHEQKEQAEPDGRFPTVAFPNPEEDGAMDLVLGLAKDVGADLVLANDPDADRLAVSVLHEGAYMPLTGNDIGCLLAHYALTEGDVPASDALLVCSVVSSPMMLEIGNTHGALAVQTLTGHKWIQNRALELEAERGLTMVFGYEEALGYAMGTLVRDKDGVSAALAMADMAAFCQSQGRTLIDEREACWRRYGMYLSDQVSLVLPGPEGREKINARMAAARSTMPETIGGLPVLAVQDFEVATRRTREGSVTPIEFPSSNVVLFELEGGHRAMLRPSGTEPKLKHYFDVRVDVADGEDIDTARARGQQIVEALVDDLVRPVD